MPLRADPLKELTALAAHERPNTRQDAASLRGFRLLAGGIFPAAFIRATSNLTGILSAVETQILFDVRDVDTPRDEAATDEWSMGDLTNNQLVIRHGGWYRFSSGGKFVANASSSSDVDPVFASLKRNGNLFAQSHTIWVKDATLATVFQVVGCVKCEEGDTITAHVIQKTAFTRTLANGDGMPWLEGCWEAMFSGAA